MSSRRARIPISIDLLELMLPAGSVIHGFTMNEFYRTIEIVVEHPSFTELNNGDPIPVKTIVAHKSSHEDHSWISKVEYAS